MIIKTSELKAEDGTLDWAAAKALGLNVFMSHDFLTKRLAFLRERGAHNKDEASNRWVIGEQTDAPIIGELETGKTSFLPAFSSDWSLAGPVRDKERIEIRHRPSPWDDVEATFRGGTPINEFAGTAMVAIMRVFVASKLGPEVEVPDALLRHHKHQAAQQEPESENQPIERPRG